MSNRDREKRTKAPEKGEAKSKLERTLARNAPPAPVESKRDVVEARLAPPRERPKAKPSPQAQPSSAKVSVTPPATKIAAPTSKEAKKPASKKAAPQAEPLKARDPAATVAPVRATQAAKNASKKPASAPPRLPEIVTHMAPPVAAPGGNGRMNGSHAAPDAATIAPPAKRVRSSQPEAASDNDRIEPSNEPAAEVTASEPVFDLASSIAANADRSGAEQAARLARGSGGDPLREAAEFGTSQSLLSGDYYFRQYNAHGIRTMAAEVDDFGFDPHVDNKVKPLLEAVAKRYFRVELVGAEHVPTSGRALLVANRAGTLPWDGLVLRTALRAERPELSPLRWLAEDSVIHTPFMGVFMNRLGAVRACPENAERLLSQDRLVAVFPEGAQGSRKLFRDRYRLQRFGRGGYVKLALKLGVPIFPTAIIGAEEVNPVFGRSRILGRILGGESVPLTPTFPWFGLAGLLPAPVRWRIVVGPAIDLSKYGPDAADDALIVHRLNEQIRSSLQSLVDQSKDARGSALFG